MKNILFVSSEAIPFMKTGGLADVVGSLPRYINKEEYDVKNYREYKDKLLEMQNMLKRHNLSLVKKDLEELIRHLTIWKKKRDL